MHYTDKAGDYIDPDTGETRRPRRRGIAPAVNGSEIVTRSWVAMAALGFLIASFSVPAAAHGAQFAPARIEAVIKLRTVGFHGVACSSTAQCTAVTERGEEVTFNPSAPATPSLGKPDDNAPDVEAVACPSADQCTLVDWNGHEVTFNPIAETSTPRVRLDEQGSLWGIACPSRTQCTAVGEHGYEVTFNPLSPAGAGLAKIDNTENVVGIACPTATQCTAATVEGEAVTFNPMVPGSSRVAVVDPNIRQSSSKRVALEDISCPSTTLCAATDQTGREVSFDPQVSPSANLTQLGQGSEHNGIACPAASQCTMVDGGAVNTFDPNALGTLTSFLWQPPSGTGATHVACPSVTLCVAVNDGSPIGGSALVFDPNPAAVSSGTPPAVPPAGTKAVSHWTRSHCVRAYRSWSRRHRHTTRSARKREVTALRRHHGCPASIAK
jgi:hypothetical protein